MAVNVIAAIRSWATRSRRRLGTAISIVWAMHLSIVVLEIESRFMGLIRVLERKEANFNNH